MTKTLTKKNLSDIIPYKNNPRHNDKAVRAVAESIRQCKYIAPIIIDENDVILAGHTRWKALQELGHDDVDVIIINGLTDEQKRKYRLLDNKTGEFAGWDFDLIAEELKDLDFEGFDFGFPKDAIIDIDDLFGNTDETPAEPKTMTCPYCGEVFEL